MSKKFVGGVIAAAAVAVAAWNVDYSDPVTGSTPSSLTKAWSNVKASAGLALLNSLDKAHSSITSTDVDKLMTVKREMNSLGGCCDIYNGKKPTYKMVISDPFERDAAGEANRKAADFSDMEQYLPVEGGMQPVNMNWLAVKSFFSNEKVDMAPYHDFIEIMKQRAGANAPKPE